MEVNPPPHVPHVSHDRVPLSGNEMRLQMAKLGVAIGGATPLFASLLLGPNILSNPFSVGTGLLLTTVSLASAAKTAFIGREHQNVIHAQPTDTLGDIQRRALQHGDVVIDYDQSQERKQKSKK